jgi:hypothetical protein
VVDDGGITWSSERARDLGVQATQTTVNIYRTG